MNCKKCGFQLNENDQFCKNCGAPVNEMNAQNIGGGLNNQTNNQNYSQPNIQQPNIQQPNIQQPMNNYNQPVMQQPGWTDGYNNSQLVNQPTKNSNIKFIIIGVIIAVVAAGVIIGINMLNQNKQTDNTNNGNGTITNVNTKSTYSIKYKGFKFNIPNDILSEVESDCVFMGDESGTWETSLGVASGSFAKLKMNKGQLQNAAKQKGITATEATIKTLGGVEFITMEVLSSGQKVLFAYAELNSSYFAGIMLAQKNNEIDYKILEKIAPIISSAEYTSSSTNIASNTKLDINDLAELAK